MRAHPDVATSSPISIYAKHFTDTTSCVAIIRQPSILRNVTCPLAAS